MSKASHGLGIVVDRGSSDRGEWNYPDKVFRIQAERAGKDACLIFR